MTDDKWARMFARQQLRADLAREWLDAIGIGPGDAVADVGCGPGYVTLLMAERVGPTGVVYAIDRDPGALAFLEERLRESDRANVRRIVGDAAAVALPPGAVRSALVAMMLHHAADPAAVVARVFTWLPPGGRAVVAEFHPDGPGEQGPPREHRIRPEQVRAWASAAGFEALDERRQTPEHYMLLLGRP